MYGRMAALIWLIVGILLVVAEVLSGDFVLIMLGAAALAAAGVSALGAGELVSVLVFAATSLGLIVGARPVLKKRLQLGSGIKMHHEALLGSRAVALTPVDEHSGQVKIGGDTWSARTLDGSVIEAGEAVTVVEISGATAVVIAAV
ncbi:membrane protein implicated in regulation of membrane protease activity [Lentzea atacamensis]|uniref:Membrane protein implicated in regulation of membrane protease activity n=3 Tax=Pseudonocardiaceae TaxID=2070 RepID=A0A316I4M7_9PSEU|nr:membrane protein implicated in regulation of membrane protease activity [Lentzea atacamensis]